MWPLFAALSSATAGTTLLEWVYMGVLLVEVTDAGSIPVSELNWHWKADEVEAAYRQPIRPKYLSDRPRTKGAPTDFSIQLALVRSNPQRVDSVLSIVV
jgi:hypothetical protein